MKIFLYRCQSQYRCARYLFQLHMLLYCIALFKSTINYLVMICAVIYFLRENLQRLLEDRSFKEEIVHFSISEDNSVVKTAHRADLFPILMRYLYCLKSDFLKVDCKKNCECSHMILSAIIMDYVILYYDFFKLGLWRN